MFSQRGIYMYICVYVCMYFFFFPKVTRRERLFFGIYISVSRTSHSRCHVHPRCSDVDSMAYQPASAHQMQKDSIRREEPSFLYVLKIMVAQWEDQRGCWPSTVGRETGDLEWAAMCLSGCRVTAARRQGGTVAAGDSTCTCEVCNHCPEFHMDQFQDNLQQALCFLGEAWLRIRGFLWPGTVPGCPGGKGISVSDTRCPVIGSSSAVPGAGGQRGKAAWSHTWLWFFPVAQSHSSKLTERCLSIT